MSNNTNGTRSRYAPLVIIVISVGWLFSLGVGAIEQNWSALTITTTLMLLVAGYTLGIEITRSGVRKRDED